MEAAGYPDGFELTLQSRQTAIPRDTATFMTSQLAKLGIRAKVNLQEDSLWYNLVLTCGHEAFTWATLMTFDDPQWQGRWWLPGAGANHTCNNDDKEIVRIWDEQIRTEDPTKRKALIRQAEEYLLEALPFVSVATPYYYVVAAPEVKNFEPKIGAYFANTLEEIWLTK